MRIATAAIRSDDVVAFTLVTALPHDSPKIEQILNLIAHPDPGSIFEEYTRDVRTSLTRQHWLGALIARQYNGAIFVRGTGEVYCGHIFWQMHRREMRIFSVFVAEPMRGNYCSYRMVLELLRRVREREWVRDVGAIVIGNGRSVAMQHLLVKLSRDTAACERYNIRVDLKEHAIVLNEG